ncbi:MAG: sialate O-acetylesterase [Bacteroidales bacterium]
MKKASIFLLLFLLLTGCGNKRTGIILPSIISDNMMLQQKTDAKIWGKATPGSKIAVSADWNAEGEAKTGDDGKWSVTIPTPEAGGPYTISISARDTSLTLNNILIGEVWFCSGQSNMEMPLAGWPPVDTVMYSAKTIANASVPEIRLFNVQRMVSGTPLEECTGTWEVCSPSSVGPFSATAYFFGKKLYDELKIPVGMIESAWGGTPAEAWISSEVLENAGEFMNELKAIKESAPLQEEYQSWLNSHKQLEVKASGDDQWRNLSLGDENVPSPEFNDNSWPVIALPGQFESVTGDFDGAVWFRKNIELSQNIAGKSLVLSLGPIDDMDWTYFNGKLVGAHELSGMWQVDRNYDIPAGLAKEGINTIAVRVLDNQGGGGIWGKPGSMTITVKNSATEKILLDGEWKYQPVAELTGNKFYIFDNANNEFSGHKRPKTIGPYTPSTLYNAMVCPVLNYPIKGAIWYQGESNVGRADQYSKIFPLMIRNWRDAWGIENFPFYFVQIAPYEYSNVDSTESAFLREAQEKALDMSNTGMAVTFDIATVMNIHPPFKKEVGERLANLALAKDYGRSLNVYGPVYKSMTVDGKAIKIQFTNTEGGLALKDEKISEFEIAGKDGKYIRADAKIINNEVLVSSLKVKDPLSVRYCWRNGSVATLFNGAGLPALQFRSKEN